MLEPGRVCIKRYGRDAGSRAVVVRVLDSGFVSIITSVRQKERKCNPKHLEFLSERIDVNDKALVNKTLGVKPREEHHSKSEKPERKSR
ncbi:MAG: 50S ribosomal protein L14e [Candidatus Micrarchaeaceae archaeon]|jgi:ribosomal protein L14E/L6E/L27E